MIVQGITDLGDQLSGLSSLDAGNLIASTLGLPAIAETSGLNSVAFYAPEGTTLDSNIAAVDTTSTNVPGAPGAATGLPPATGNRRAIVLLVQFPDQAGVKTPADFAQLLFSGGTPGGQPATLKDYYLTASYGQLTVDGAIYGWYTLPHNQAYYANGTSAMGMTEPNGKTLVNDAIDCARAAGVDFSGFDVDNDGYLDGLIVVHAGTGAETVADAATRRATIWSHKWTLPSPRTLNGKTAYAYTVMPEDGKLGVFCHEFGHFLGLPDLYDTRYRSRGVGKWCLMGAGSWGGGGDHPTNMSAWSRARLGWVSPTALSGTNTGQLLKASHVDRGVIRLDLTGSPAEEYFLLEHRQQLDLDSGVPGGGLLIWRIDDRVSGNDDPSHYQVEVVQADGSNDLENNRNNGDATDPYDGTTYAGFDNATTPSSKSWEGTPSDVAVSNIRINGDTITLDVIGA